MDACNKIILMSTVGQNDQVLTSVAKGSGVNLYKSCLALNVKVELINGKWS